MWHATKPALLPPAELVFFCTWFAYTMLLSVNRFSVLNQTQSIHNIRPIHDPTQDCNLLKRSQWSKWSDSSSQAPLIARALPWLCEASSSGCCAVLIAGEKRGSAKMQIPRKAQPSKVGKTRSCRRLQSREPDQISKRSRNEREREGPCHDSGKAEAEKHNAEKQQSSHAGIPGIKFKVPKHVTPIRRSGFKKRLFRHCRWPGNWFILKMSAAKQDGNSCPNSELANEFLGFTKMFRRCWISKTYLKSG